MFRKIVTTIALAPLAVLVGAMIYISAKHLIINGDWVDWLLAIWALAAVLVVLANIEYL